MLNTSVPAPKLFVALTKREYEFLMSCALVMNAARGMLTAKSADDANDAAKSVGRLLALIDDRCALGDQAEAHFLTRVSNDAKTTWQTDVLVFEAKERPVPMPPMPSIKQ